MAERVRAFDWTQTPLGSMALWPQSLRTAVQIMLASRYAMFIWWGESLTNLYNDAYIPMLGRRHPFALGQSGRAVWTEIWNTVGPQTEIVLREGRSTWNEELLLVMERNDFTEETYFTFSYSPILHEDGGIAGLLGVCTEDTARVLGRRRLKTLRDLAERSLKGKTVEQAISAAAITLAENPYDLSFATVYLLSSNGQTAHLTQAGNWKQFQGQAPGIIDLTSGDLLGFRSALESGKMHLIDLAGAFGPLSAGVWPQPVEEAAVVPLAGSAVQDIPAGFLVAGLSPRLQFDNEYRGFLELVGQQIAIAIANATGYEEDRSRVEALAELDRAKTAFFSNVSHEFRTPLTLMLGALERVLESETPLPAQVHEQIATAHRNSLRLLKLVNSLLDFSRIEAGRVQAQYQAVDLAAVTAEIASIFRSATEQAGLDFRVDCPKLPEAIYVDREMWEKIVLNLISNAFKFTLEGSIRVELSAAGQNAELKVIDTGTGIPSQEIPHLFDRFHRVEGLKGRTHEGTGIGLALVQELVKMHEGTTSVESELGKGSVFTVRIPFGTQHLPGERIVTPIHAVSTSTRPEAYVQEVLRWLPVKGEQVSSNGLPAAIEQDGSFDLASGFVAEKRPRVLLAEDNADLREYVRRLLAKYIDVEAVSNGQEALLSALANPPDLLLSDVMMPVLDGFALLKELRANDTTRTLPVILLSARAGEEARQGGMDAGADDYLVKPFSDRELLARVNAHLKLAQARKQTEQALRESQALLASALEAGRAGAFEWDIVHNVNRWSPELERLYGLEPGSFGGTLKAWTELIHPGDLPNAMAIAQQAIDSGKLAAEWRVLHADGSVRWLRASGHIFYDELRRPLRMTGINVDITDQKRAEEELRATNVELQRVNRELEEFAYVASHDLQEPLRMVNAYSQLLTRRLANLNPQDAQTYVGFIGMGVRRMEQLIQDLLSFARTVHNEKPVAESVDLKASLDRAVQTLRVPIESSNAHIEAGDLPAVMADETQVTQLWQNLLSNAIKYAKQNVPPYIQIGAVRQEGEWIVSVQDNGIGFSQEYAKQVFGLFKRLHRSEYPGTGLGLAICKRIVERYGGRIWVESAPGEGSKFSFSLPASSEP